MIGKSQDYREGYWQALQDVAAAGLAMQGTPEKPDRGDEVVRTAIGIMEKINSDIKVVIELTKPMINKNYN